MFTNINQSFFADYFMLFVIYGFLGFIAQEIFTFSQGFLPIKFVAAKKLLTFLPLTPIYGFGCLLLLFLKENFLPEAATIIDVFLISFAAATLLELFVGELLKLIFGENKWWNYKHSLIQFDEQICLENSLLFGVGGVIVIYVIQPLLTGLISVHNWQLPAMILGISLVADTIYSLYLIGKKTLEVEVRRRQTSAKVRSK